MTNSVEQFEQLLNSHENKDSGVSVAKKTSPQKNIAELICSKNVEELKKVLPTVPQQTLGSPTILVALLENFDSQVADALLAHKINLEKIWKRNGDLIAPLSPQFIQWLPIASIGDEIIKRLLEKSFEVLRRPLNSEQNVALAEFAIQVQKLRPDLCENSLTNGYYFFEDIISSNPLKLMPQQWEMISKCITESLWKAELNNLNIQSVEEFQTFFVACKNVSTLNKLVKHYFERSRKEGEWLTQVMISPTGKIEDSALIHALQDPQKSEARNFLHNRINKEWKNWKLPENLQVLLLNREPCVLEEEHYENQGWFTQVYYANGYQSFLHILLQSCGAKGIDILKTNNRTEDELCKVFDILDVSEFLTLSTPLEIKKILQTFPKLVQWTDVAGNNLGMYIAAQTSSSWKKNKDVLKILLKYPHFREDNPYGVSPRLFLNNRYSNEQLAEYDKSLLKTELKQSFTASNPPKIRRKM